MLRLLAALLFCALLSGCSDDKSPLSETASATPSVAPSTRKAELPPCCTLPGRASLLKGKGSKPAEIATTTTSDK